MRTFFLSALSLAAYVAAHGDHGPPPVASEEKANDAKPTIQYQPVSGIVAPLFEPFDYENWTKTWKFSNSKKVIDGVTDEKLLAYNGKAAVEEPSIWPGLIGDKGLVFKSASAHYGLSTVFDTPVDPKGKTLVVQYEVKFQTPLECGGAYMKLLTFDKDFDAEKLHDKTPYTIMFGPDKCGFSKKVHFIFRHINPKNGEVEEKHLKTPPEGTYSKRTTLYTLIVKPDNSFEILVNNESAKKGNLLEDFDPPVTPPKEIDDPEDNKPADWVDEAEIPDSGAEKPVDWDEDAPMFIPDEDAKKPDDWLDDEPDTVPDLDAKKPEDWDDEEDGDWIAPSIANSKCAKSSGCGEWKRPQKRNPNYKGKWVRPMISNPAYKGVWVPKKIANPDYFEDKTPANFNKIGGLAFEIWTVQDNILLDNVYVGHSVEDAQKLANELWKVKYDAEAIHEKEEKKINEEAAKEAQKDLTLVEHAQIYLDLGKRYYKEFRYDFDLFMKRAQESPVEAVKEYPQVLTVLAGAVFALLVPFMILGAFTSSKPAKKVVPKTTAEKKKNDDDEREEEEDAASAAATESEADEVKPAAKSSVRARKTKTKNDE